MDRSCLKYPGLLVGWRPPLFTQNQNRYQAMLPVKGQEGVPLLFFVKREAFLLHSVSTGASCDRSIPVERQGSAQTNLYPGLSQSDILHEEAERGAQKRALISVFGS